MTSLHSSSEGSMASCGAHLDDFFENTSKIHSFKQYLHFHCNRNRINFVLKYNALTLCIIRVVMAVVELYFSPLLNAPIKSFSVFVNYRT